MGDVVLENPPRRVQQIAKELAESNGFLLATLGLAFKTLALEKLEEAGFEAHQYSVLAVLGEGSSEAQATLAEALAIDPSRLVAVLDTLEQRGLIARERDPNDRRRHVVSITAAGRREHSKLRAIVKQFEDGFFEPLESADRERLHVQLMKLAAHHDPRCAFDDSATVS
jgi:DNA-binding MarR family transcriptional regulator